MDPVEKYKQDVKDLPLWLKYFTAVATILAIPSLMFGAWTGYQAIANSSSSQALATTTPNVSEIFSQYNSYSRGVDQQNFLSTYLNTQVVGTISFENISKISSSDNSYLLYGFVSTGLLSSTEVACSFGDVDDATNRRLNLLSKGEKVIFSANFTGSVDGDTGYWYLSDCSFLDN